MAIITRRIPTPTEPYQREHWSCPNCVSHGTRYRGKGHRCPQCGCRVDITRIAIVVPKPARCHYCGRSDCPCIEALIEKARLQQPEETPRKAGAI